MFFNSKGEEKKLLTYIPGGTGPGTRASLARDWSLLTAMSFCSGYAVLLVALLPT